MRFYKCDKCGKEVKTDNAVDFSVYFQYGKPPISIDDKEFCQKCAKDLSKIIKEFVE